MIQRLRLHLKSTYFAMWELIHAMGFSRRCGFRLEGGIAFSVRVSPNPYPGSLSLLLFLPKKISEAEYGSKISLLGNKARKERQS